MVGGEFILTHTDLNDMWISDGFGPETPSFGSYPPIASTQRSCLQLCGDTPVLDTPKYHIKFALCINAYLKIYIQYTGLTSELFL